MKKWQLTALMVTMIASQLFGSCFIAGASAQTNPNVYIGVDIAYGDTADAKAEIDKVSSFTNLVLFGSTGVTWFPDRVNETFQYAFDKSLSVISLAPSLLDSSSIGLNKTEWYTWAQNTWGNKVLGFYILDEPGGRTLDGNFSQAWNQYTGYPTSYSDAAARFTAGVSGFINSPNQKPSSYYKVFTSDYAFYWYDYKAGYDVVFTELGGNYSQQINIALCRGAAVAQNKDWGAIITWTYTEPPYIESGEQLYNDMVLAYDNGAKYIIVFDGDAKNHGILQQEHFDAIQRFYNYAQSNQPKSNIPKNERTAYVLPNAYGFGFRWPTDHIWGLWQPDELTANISLSVGTLLTQYGEKLDIIYDDALQNGANGYNQLIYWNSYDPLPTTSPSPSPLPTPSPSPTISPTLNNPTPLPLQTSFVIAVAAVSVSLLSVFFVIHFKKRKKNLTPSDL